MKLETEFRGKRIDNGEWIYGDLCHNANGGYSIMPKPFFTQRLVKPRVFKPGI